MMQNLLSTLKIPGVGGPMLESALKQSIRWLLRSLYDYFEDRIYQVAKSNGKKQALNTFKESNQYETCGYI